MMYQFTELFFYKSIFTIEILIIMHLFSFHLPKKKNPILRYVSSVLGCIAFSIAIPIPPQFAYTWYFSSILFTILFGVCFASLFLVYKVSWQRLFFISISAYTVQHFSHELFSLIMHAFDLVDDTYLGIYGDEIITFNNLPMDIFQMMTYIEIYVMAYIISYLVLGNKMNKFDVKVNSGSIMIISSLILLTDIIFNSVIVYLNMEYNKSILIIVGAYNLICCLMILYIQYSVVDNRQLKKDLQTISLLLHQSEEKFAMSRENVDLINLKVHDLKHIIREYGEKRNIPAEAVNELQEIINIYDSNMQTGNDVLDLILREKSLVCQKKNIKLSCLADCSKLDFVSEADLYSLFGNAIDNAIEAVVKINDPEKRQINLNIKNVRGFISVTLKNYFEGEIKLDNENFPITTKDNRDYHGFGLKSIKMITSKYEGDLKISIEDDVFALSILFSIIKNEEV